MDEETKKAILETRDLMAELLAMTKEKKASMEARAKGNGVDDVLKQIFERLPPHMRSVFEKGVKP